MGDPLRTGAIFNLSSLTALRSPRPLHAPASAPGRDVGAGSSAAPTALSAAMPPPLRPTGVPLPARSLMPARPIAGYGFTKIQIDDIARARPMPHVAKSLVPPTLAPAEEESQVEEPPSPADNPPPLPCGGTASSSEPLPGTTDVAGERRGSARKRPRGSSQRQATDAADTAPADAISGLSPRRTCSSSGEASRRCSNTTVDSFGGMSPNPEPQSSFWSAGRSDGEKQRKPDARPRGTSHRGSPLEPKVIKVDNLQDDDGDRMVKLTRSGRKSVPVLDWWGSQRLTTAADGSAALDLGTDSHLGGSQRKGAPPSRPSRGASKREPDSSSAIARMANAAGSTFERLFSAASKKGGDAKGSGGSTKGGPIVVGGAAAPRKPAAKGKRGDETKARGSAGANKKRRAAAAAPAPVAGALAPPPPTARSRADNEWSVDEVAELHVAHLSVAPTRADFWEEVARQVGSKTAGECHAKWFQQFDTASPKQKAPSGHQTLSDRKRMRAAMAAASSARNDSATRDGDANHEMLPESSDEVHGTRGGKRPRITKRQLAEQHARVEVDDIFSEAPSKTQTQVRSAAGPGQAVAKPSQKQINQLKKRCRGVTLETQPGNGDAHRHGAARKAKPGKGAVLAASVGQFQARGLLTDTGLTRTVKMTITGPDSDLEVDSQHDLDSDESEDCDEGPY